VQALAAEQQELTHKLKENYDWMASQLEGFGDKDALAQVGGGLATGGVAGGLESFGQVLLGKKAAAGGDALKSEVERRLDELSAIFRRNAAGAGADPGSKPQLADTLINASQIPLLLLQMRLYSKAPAAGDPTTAEDPPPTRP
jgi:hypothetical protein